MDATDRTSLAEMLGLGGRRGLAWLALLQVNTVLLMLRGVEAAGDDPRAVVAFGLILVAGFVVVLPQPDPLPWPFTVVALGIGPLATYLGCVNGHDHTIWTSLAYQVVLGLLAVRRRVVPAWIGVAAIAVVAALDGTRHGADASAVTTSITPIGLVLALSVFTKIMRPTQESLRALRIEATVKAGQEASIAARTAERDRHLAHLDRVARPRLEQLAAGVPLSAADRVECGLLEAELRDGLRAPRLATPALAPAVRAARLRGVEVILLDDGGFADVPAHVCDAVLAILREEIGLAAAGTITARVLPPGRDVLASAVTTGESDYRRVEIAPDGSVGQRGGPPPQQRLTRPVEVA